MPFAREAEGHGRRRHPEATSSAGASSAGPREAVTANLKQRIAEAATVLRGRGHGWHTIGHFFGIPHETVRRFAGGNPASAFVPVEVVGTASVGMSLVTPDGYRVEGLGAADVAEILLRLR